jgi:hypothetical protein
MGWQEGGDNNDDNDGDDDDDDSDVMMMGLMKKNETVDRRKEERGLVFGETLVQRHTDHGERLREVDGSTVGEQATGTSTCSGENGTVARKRRRSRVKIG